VPRGERLDAVLVRRGLFPSRAQAAAAVLAGQVWVDGRQAAKPGVGVRSDAEVRVERPAHGFASRGGVKLAGALDAFGLDVAGAACLDVGASTGGFTDCLLQRGAARVHAVDVGYGQLAWRLREDPRVVVRERTNARHLTAADVPDPVDLAVIDVSFIGLEKVLPAIGPLVAPAGAIVALCKPQFQAGRADVPRGGVVRDPAVHRRVLREVAAAAAALGWRVWGLAPSPLRGADGNREFYFYWRRSAAPGPLDLAAAVEAALAEGPVGAGAPARAGAPVGAGAHGEAGPD
jgi:23S rRNA (cytidine1920-2'-O)/16S rRNA (cytidine1409-2'-O)-methyltransferase